MNFFLEKNEFFLDLFLEKFILKNIIILIFIRNYKDTVAESKKWNTDDTDTKSSTDLHGFLNKSVLEHPRYQCSIVCDNKFIVPFLFNKKSNNIVLYQYFYLLVETPFLSQYNSSNGFSVQVLL